MQYKYENTFRKGACQPLDDGFLWGKREGSGTGQGNTRDHNFLSDVLFLEKDKWSKETLRAFFQLRHQRKERENAGNRVREEWDQDEQNDPGLGTGHAPFRLILSGLSEEKK